MVTSSSPQDIVWAHSRLHSDVAIDAKTRNEVVMYAKESSVLFGGTHLC